MGLFGRRKKYNEQRQIIIDTSSHHAGMYGYTRLKDNLLYINSDGAHKVIQMESAMSHEGKTSVCANLAVSLGLTEKKVVVVDLDLRRPRMHRLFMKEKDGGIAEYMKGELTEEEIIKHTEYENVDLITRGAEIYNPSLVFVSEKFKGLIEGLKEKYDFILLDCAPIMQTSDYIHVGKISDGVLYLVAYGSTTRSQVSDAVKELKKNNIPILGTVFTMYDRKKDGYYGYYGKYYDEIYTDDKKKARKKPRETEEEGEE